MILMPLMVCSWLWENLALTVLVGQWIAYGIQQVDKTGLSTQATFGIIADTHMKGNDYAWLSTIFFICVRNLALRLSILSKNSI
jgi:hypothetical protein